jgi:hypothetical protein
MQAIQDLLTLAIEVTASAGFGGITLHAIWSHHCKWMATYCPPLGQPQQALTEAAAEDTLRVESVIEPVVTPTEPDAAMVVEPVIEAVGIEEAVIKDSAVVAIEKLLATPAITDYYSTLSVAQLRGICTSHNIDWRSGGDYGRPMRKAQMIQALC